MNVPEHFPRISEHSRRCPKIAGDCRRLSKETRRCFDDTPTHSSTIKRQTWYHRHHRYLHMWRYHIFTCEDIISFLSVCYHSLYHWLLYNKKYYFNVLEFLERKIHAFVKILSDRCFCCFPAAMLNPILMGSCILQSDFITFVIV